MPRTIPAWYFPIMRWLGLVFLTVLFLGSTAQSEVPWAPTYGPEIEFGHPGIDRRSGGTYGSRGLMPEREHVVLLAEAIEKKCRRFGCRVEDHRLTSEDTYQAQTAKKVIFDDGFYFLITADPGCIEIKARPSSLRQWQRYGNILQDLLFETAMSEGFVAGDTSNAGQISFGLQSTFGDDADFFMAFLVEANNRPELALGILGYDLLNAPPLSVLSQSQRNTLEQLIISHAGNPKTINQIARQVNRAVYSQTTAMEDVPEHYHAWSYEKAVISDRSPTPETLRIEGRLFRAPTTMGEYVTQLEFMQTWLNYIKQQPISDMVYAKSTMRQEAPIVMAMRFQALLNDMNISQRKKNEFWNLVPEEIAYWRIMNPLRQGIDLGSRGSVGDLESIQLMYQTADLILISPTARELYLQTLSKARAIEQNAHIRFFDKLASLVRARDIQDSRTIQSIESFMNEVAARAPSQNRIQIRTLARETSRKFGPSAGRCRTQFKSAG